MTRKTTLLSLGALAIVAVGVVLFLSLAPADGIMTKKNGTYIVNTTKLTPNVRGYAGPTPLEITIKGDKITDIKALPNHDTPDFFVSAKNKLFKQYKGKTVAEALALQPDGATGATYSSRAIVTNLQEGLKYYKAHK
ncbi:MAG: FMN-binding protein [Bacteroidaceae bacterium]|nr:FMN-binding protein [Bacteroidaceae bacterium]